MDIHGELPEVRGDILCAASAYEEKFYLNPDFGELPRSIQEELQIMCVLYTADVGGILTLHFDEEGNLLLHVTAREDDLLFDEIGSVLKIKEIQGEKRELLEALELYYRAVFLGEDVSGLLEEDG
ncbi:MAG: hypothetical protein HFH62_01205 [Lachnospiraceae bacterium]|nr:hypothetical protein [Lachnospiraceae bacterium]